MRGRCGLYFSKALRTNTQFRMSFVVSLPQTNSACSVQVWKCSRLLLETIFRAVSALLLISKAYMSLNKSDFTSAQPSTIAIDAPAFPNPRQVFTPVEPKPREPRLLIGSDKKCGNCNASKDLSEFAMKVGTRRSSTCRSCTKVHSTAHYQRNRQAVIEATAERNVARREKLTEIRDNFLEKHCVCEACSSTVGLRLTARPGYDGPAVHEVMGSALSLKRLTAALEGSQVFCSFCMGGRFGKVGGAQKKLNALSRAAQLSAS